jgi:hypothetical protein
MLGERNAVLGARSSAHLRLGSAVVVFQRLVSAVALVPPVAVSADLDFAVAVAG